MHFRLKSQQIIRNDFPATPSQLTYKPCRLSRLLETVSTKNAFLSMKSLFWQKSHILSKSRFFDKKCGNYENIDFPWFLGPKVLKFNRFCRQTSQLAFSWISEWKVLRAENIFAKLFRKKHFSWKHFHKIFLRDRGTQRRTRLSIEPVVF